MGNAVFMRVVETEGRHRKNVKQKGMFKWFKHFSKSFSTVNSSLINILYKMFSLVKKTGFILEERCWDISSFTFLFSSLWLGYKPTFFSVHFSRTVALFMICNVIFGY